MIPAFLYFRNLEHFSWHLNLKCLRNVCLPNRSIAYTGRVTAKASKFKHHKATPAPRPWRRTSGVFGDSVLKDTVHILSAGPTTGPMSTYQPRCGVRNTKNILKIVKNWSV